MNAPDKATEIKAIFAGIIGFGTALWGNLGWMIIVLVVCIALDYLTGTAAAMKNGKWSSAMARQGLWHKLGEIVALLVAALCDIAVRIILQSAAASVLDGLKYPEGLFVALVCIWYIFTELGSIIENAADLGAPIPKWLTQAIARIREKSDPAEPENEAADQYDAGTVEPGKTILSLNIQDNAALVTEIINADLRGENFLEKLKENAVSSLDTETENVSESDTLE